MTQAQAHGDELDGQGREFGPEVLGVLGEPDSSGRNRERRGEEDHPDEEKRHQPAHLLRAVGFPEVDVGASRSRHRGAQLCPDQPVTDGQRSPRAATPAWRAGRPMAAIRIGIVMKGPIPQHLDHVGRDGFLQP